MSVKRANPIRGTRDILPDEMDIRRRTERAILDVYNRAGFREIETPALEDLDLLLGSDGGENLKMIYSITKRGDKFAPKQDSTVRDLCDTGLRFDLTLPLSRYFANNKDKLEMPFKALQTGNVFRAERPQKGRFRSFRQCDIDIIGDAGPEAEIELIHTTAQALENAGFTDFTVKINDRRLLNAFITAFGFAPEDTQSICIVLDKLDKIGHDGVIAELIEKGYDEEKVHKFTQAAEHVTLDTIAEVTKDTKTVDELKRIIDTVSALSGGNYHIVFDFSLIRGMGYYTGPVFEVSWGDVGYSIAGGGRYDNMIGKFSKESVPAVGFSIGFERIIGILCDELLDSEPDNTRLMLFYNRVSDDFTQVLKKADSLRMDGYSVTLAPAKKKLGKQIHQANEAGYGAFLVYGRDDSPRSTAE